MAVEKRNIRIEDWLGNIYYPETSSLTSVAGYTIDASDASTTYGSAIYTEGSVVSDNMANKGKSIILNPSEADKILIDAEFVGIPFGNVAISFRAKSSIKSDDKLFKLECYHVDNTTEVPTYYPLSSKVIKGTDFDDISTYKDLSFILNYAGTYSRDYALRVKVTRYGLESEEGSKASFILNLDNISATKAFPGINPV